MLRKFGIVHAAWTHTADDGRRLERVVGECGLDYVVVPVVTGRRHEISLAGNPDQPEFWTAGGWHYPHSAAAYDRTTVKPPRARWFGSADRLGRLADHVDRLGLGLVPRIDLGHATTLLDRHSHLRRRNAWGQDDPHHLCTVNPEVADLLDAILTDLQRYEPAGIELIGLDVDPSPDRTSSARDVPPNASVWRCMQVCFCPHCRAAANAGGVDADAVARAVRELATARSNVVGSDTRLDDSDADRAAYVELRRTQQQDWLQRLGDTHSVVPVRIVATSGAGAAEIPAVGRLLQWTSTDEAAAQPERFLRRAAEIDAAGIVLPTWSPVFADSAVLVRTVVDAVRAGLTVITFDGFDGAPDVSITALKQAVRYARRD